MMRYRAVTGSIGRRSTAWALWLAVVGASLSGQAPRTKADRGFYPTGVYTSSQLDSVNNVNGNLIFRLPITSLPAGRAGEQAGLELVYNSAIYDISQAYSSESTPQPPQPILTNRLVGSSQGGWRYSLMRGGTPGPLGPVLDGYGLVFEQRPLPPSGCNSGDPKTWRVYKLYFQTPDGGQHALRRLGYNDELGDGYFAWNADNNADLCRPGNQDLPVPTSAPVYFTTDGSYIRVQFTDTKCDLSGPNSFTNKLWLAYFPDGSLVEGCPQQLTMVDRNGNRSFVYKYVNEGHPVTVIENSVGRSIEITHYAPSGELPQRDVIARKDATDGANLTWTVSWTTAGPDPNGSYICADGDRFCSIGPQSFASVQSVVLPNGLGYSFNYDTGTGGWGELSRVTLPESLPPGLAAFSPKIEYAYAEHGVQRQANRLLENPIASRKLYYRDFKADGTAAGDSTTPRETWTYTFSNFSSTITAPDGSNTVSSFFDMTGLSNPLHGLVYKTEEPLGRVVERRWEQNKPLGNQPLAQNTANAYVKTEYVTVGNASNVPAKTAVKDFTYDRNGNVTAIAEYDWAAYVASAEMRTAIPSGATLVRRTTNTMKFPVAEASATTVDETNAYWNPSSDRMRFAVRDTKVFHADGTTRAFTQLTHDANGNLTSEAKWNSAKAATAPGTLSVASASVIERGYDSFGNATSIKDPNGHQTTMTYGPVCNTAGLYVTQRTEPGPRTFTYQWNCPMGLASSETDVENGVTKSTSFDIYGRLISTTEAGMRKRSMSYSDGARVVRSASDLLTYTDGLTATVTGYDDIGRPHLVRTADEAAGTPAAAETSNGVKAKRLYWPAVGGLRYEAESNPYRASLATGATGAGERMGWTRTMSDALGRGREVETFSGATPPFPWGSATSLGKVTTEYGAGEVTVTDESGRSERWSTTDWGGW